MHTTCIALHVVQPSAVLADPPKRLIVETPPVSVRTPCITIIVSTNVLVYI